MPTYLHLCLTYPAAPLRSAAVGSTVFTFNITLTGTYNLSVLTSDGRTLTVCQQGSRVWS